MSDRSRTGVHGTGDRFDVDVIARRVEGDGAGRRLKGCVGLSRLTKVLICGLGCCLASCGDDVPQGQGALVALVNGAGLSADRVRDYAASRNPTAGPSLDVESVLGLVDELVLGELLYQEALATGIGDEPNVQSAIRQVLTQRLLEDRVVRPVLDHEISDDELSAYFERHRGEFTWPEQVRLADIFVAVPADASDVLKAQKRQQAEMLLRKATRLSAEGEGLGGLIEAHSDEQPAFALGDTGYFDRQGAPSGIEPELVRAGFSLERSGALFDEVVETASGYHVVMRTGHRSAKRTDPAEIADTLRQRIRREALKARRREYFRGLRERASVTVDNDAVSALAAELAAGGGGGPAVPGPMPAAGDATGPPSLSEQAARQ